MKKTLILLIFLTTNYVNVAFAACIGTGCLPDIESHTDTSKDHLSTIKDKVEDESNFWKAYVEKYLQLTTTTTPYDTLPSTANLQTDLYRDVLEAEDNDLLVPDTTTTSITQGMIDKVISGRSKSFLRDLMTNKNDLKGFKGITPNDPPSSSPNPNNEALNINTLLNTSSIDITTDEGQLSYERINNLIRIISGGVSPMPFKQSKDPKTSADDWNKYLINRWDSVAKLSLSMTNFYHMMQRRIAVPGLGTKAGIPSKPNASPYEVQEYQVKKRLGDPEWYTRMEEASPLVIQRESLHILAEMQKLLQDSQKLDERVLASLSVIVAQNAEIGKVVMKVEEAQQQQQGGGGFS